jgi:hypothetical protein
MDGLGFMIWQVARCPIDQAIAALKRAGASWVSVKVANSSRPYNQVNGSDDPLVAYLEQLRAAGFEVGGWHYIYPQSPAAQGRIAEERRQKLSLAHMLVDAESEWTLPGLGDEAEAYMNELSVPDGYTVALCSYRYPTVHAPFPFARFINHKNSNAIAPQVYWIGRHDPKAQIVRSYGEHQMLQGVERPFFPIGAAFATGLKGAQGYWEPFDSDFREFMQTCKDMRFKAYGFYSLDWVLQYQRNDWLDAIAGIETRPPEPGPEPGKFRMMVDVDVLNVRDGPTTRARDVGDLARGTVVEVESIEGSDAWVKIGPNRYACVKSGTRVYLRIIE